MALQVKLYFVPQEDGEPEYISPLPAKIDDTYASFRVFLEEEDLREFSFDFWMIEDKKQMLQKFEKWNSIAVQVHVIPKVGLGDLAAKRRRIDECCDLPTETAQILSLLSFLIWIVATIARRSHLLQLEVYPKRSPLRYRSCCHNLLQKR
jgi:hypothetical protein